MKQIEYERDKVIEYARKWAFSRNPQYYNYDLLGGDCTNFASQCVYSGNNIMNYNRNNGWYYIDANNKSPSWTGVDFFFNFIISNKLVGPYGIEVEMENIMLR